MLSPGFDKKRVATITVPELSMAPKQKRQKRLPRYRVVDAPVAVTDASAIGHRLTPACDSNNETTSSSRKSESQIMSKTPNPINGIKDGIEEVRQKLLIDLKNATDKLKKAIFMNEEAEQQQQKWESPQSAVMAPVAVEGLTRWNLRKRHADGKALVSSRLKINENSPNDSSPATNGGGSTVKPTLRRESEKTQRVKFTVELSRKEIEEDYMMLLGHRPPRRPSKRPKAVQKDLDAVFPGLSKEVTPDLYKVSEPRIGKVRKGKKGLKGLMQSCDSDEDS